MKDNNAAKLIFLWLAIVFTSLYFRPLMPIDETRYVSVAWDMWHGGNFWVPQINGQPYSDKPPLLFYLIHMGWFFLGVNEWSARLTGPIFGLLNLFLTARLARRLWPDDTMVGSISPFVLLSMPLWAVLTTMTMFDMVLCFFVLVSVFGLLSAGFEKKHYGWLLLAAGIGGGILTKGPIVLLFVLPPGLLAPWWTRDSGPVSWWRWYGGLSGALLVGIGIALVWVLPAARFGGAAYADAILWGQTAGRMVKSFAHQRPFWWYIPMLMLAVLPWSWRIPCISRQNLDHASKFLLSWSIPGFILLSLVSGKQIHYLIPLLPPLALLVSRRLVSTPSRVRAEAYILTGLYLLVGAFLIIAPFLTVYWPDWAPFMDRPVVWPIICVIAAVIFLGIPQKNIAHAISASCAAMVFLIIMLHIVFYRQTMLYYDVSPMAERMAAIQQSGKTVAVYPEKYAIQFQFSGRLDTVVGLDSRQQLEDWLEHNPGQYVVFVSEDLPLVKKELWNDCLLLRPFRDEWTSLWQAEALNRALSSL
jgi:4-amino-4-deoxy-L-arabinose transferase-like glycosyltransferase